MYGNNKQTIIHYCNNRSKIEFQIVIRQSLLNRVTYMINIREDQIKDNQEKLSK